MLKKIILVCVGILFSLITLELSLQSAGFLISKYREFKNNAALKNKSEYTVMCLGESTTSQAYPWELQKILNKKHPGKFSVIDCGVPAIKLDFILKNLDDNIDKYKPDIAVCMMGINNGFVSFDEIKKKSNKKIERFKLYKLYNLLKEHLKASLKIKEAYADNSPELNADYAYQLYFQKKYSASAKICEEILETGKNDYNLYSFLAMLYFYHLNRKDSAYEMALNIIKTNKQVSDYWKQIIYEISIQYNIKNRKNIKSAKRFINLLVNDANVLFSEMLYSGIKDYMTPEQKTRFAKKMYFYKNALDQYYGAVAVEMMEKKDYEKAEEYFKIAENLRIEHPNRRANEIYKLIIKKLTDNNIKVICMQYPVRSIEPLKQMLEDEEYYGRIEFLSNEDNFKNMLKEKQFFEIFSDQFAGDFGHYKKEGGTLIAENLVERLSKLVQ